MSRFFIIEPSLILDTGHVKKCTEIFAQASLDLNKKTLIVVPFSAPKVFPSKPNLVLRLLPNCYEKILYDKKLYNTSYTSVIFFFLPKKIKIRTILFVDRLFWYLKSYIQMRTSIKYLFDSEKISSQDTLILPNGDLLCTSAIVKFIQRQGKNSSPKLSIRFINVMENVGVPMLISKHLLFRKLRIMEKRGFRIRITSETINYRLFLAKYLKIVGLCEYPSKSTKMIARKPKRTTIGILGSARPDKGFEQLRTIIPIIKASSLGEGVKFYVQESTFSWGAVYEEVMYSLNQFSSVKILPGYISEKEMNNLIKSCTALLLPYDADTYMFRGSAMLFDAADLGIPVIAPARTGMGTTIRHFGIGAVYSNLVEIPSAIRFISNINQKELYNRFKIYNNSRNSNMRKFLE